MTKRPLQVVLAASLIGATATAYAQPSIVHDVMAIHDSLDAKCRGWSGDDPHTDEICEVRLKAEKLLGKLGYCYGRKSDFEAGERDALGHSGINVPDKDSAIRLSVQQRGGEWLSKPLKTHKRLRKSAIYAAAASSPYNVCSVRTASSV